MITLRLTRGNGILDPKGKATRAAVAAMLMRYLQAAEQYPPKKTGKDDLFLQED